MQSPPTPSRLQRGTLEDRGQNTTPERGFLTEKPLAQAFAAPVAISGVVALIFFVYLLRHLEGTFHAGEQP
jgi:hypothetical protein